MALGEMIFLMSDMALAVARGRMGGGWKRNWARRARWWPGSSRRSDLEEGGRRDGARQDHDGIRSHGGPATGEAAATLPRWTATREGSRRPLSLALGPDGQVGVCARRDCRAPA